MMWKALLLCKQAPGALCLSALVLLFVALGCALLPSPFLVVIGCLLLGIGGVAVCCPRIALLLLFLGASFPAMVVPLPGFTLHIIDPIIVLLLLVVIVQRKVTCFILPHLLALLFLMIALFSFIHVPEISSSASTYSAEKRLVELLLILLAFYCGTSLASAIKSITTFLATILLVHLPLYSIGLAEALKLQLPPFLAFPGAYDPALAQGRLWGPFPWSVNFGMYLANLLVIALVCWLRGERRWQRMVGFLLTLLTMLEIIGSGTRSVLLASAIVLIIACIATKRYKVLGGTLFLGGGAGVIFFNTFKTLLEHDSISTGNRLFIWNEVLKLILANPWIGIGLQQFHYYYQQFLVGETAQLGPQGIHPHEQYLEWAMESGVLWAIIGLLFLLSVMTVCWLAYRRVTREQQNMLLVASLAVLAQTIVGIFDAPFDQLEGMVVLFLLVGLALGYVGGWRGERKLGQVRSTLAFRVDKWRARKFQLPQFVPQWQGHGTMGMKSHRPGLLPIQTKERDGPDQHKTGRSILLQVLLWGVALPVIFPMTALLARYFGPARYGEYSLTFPFLTAFALLSGTGMDPLIIRQLSSQPRTVWGEILGDAAGTRLLSTLLSSGCAVLVACVLPISAEQRSLFLVGSLSLFFSFSFNGVRIIYSHGFRAEQRISLLALLETSNRVLTALLIALLIWLHLSLLWSYILLVYSDIPLFFVQVVVARKRFGIRLRLRWSQFCKHMLEGLPLLGRDMLTLLAGQADLGILLIMANPIDVGIYALASRTIDPLLAIAIAYMNGLYPLLCKTFKVQRARYEFVYHEGLRILMLFMVPCALCVSMSANTIVTLLGGAHFTRADSAVRLLIWAMVLTFCNQVAGGACIAAQMEQKLPWVTAITTGVNIILNLVLIPHLNITGAGMAALLSEGLGTCLLSVLLRPHIRVVVTARIIFLILLSNLPALLFLFWQHSAPLVLTIPCALVLTTGSYLVTRLLTWKDIEQVKQLLHRKLSKESSTVEIKTMEDVDGEEAQWSIVDYPTLVLPQL